MYRVQVSHGGCACDTWIIWKIWGKWGNHRAPSITNLERSHHSLPGFVGGDDGVSYKVETSNLRVRKFISNLLNAPLRDGSYPGFLPRSGNLTPMRWNGALSHREQSICTRRQLYHPTDACLLLPPCCGLIMSSATGAPGKFNGISPPFMCHFNHSQLGPI